MCVFKPADITATALYLQRKGERQIRLHRPTGWQHDLMGPQDLLGALKNDGRR